MVSAVLFITFFVLLVLNVPIAVCQLHSIRMISAV